jgi:hypothetical protein
MPRTIDRIHLSSWLWVVKIEHGSLISHFTASRLKSSTSLKENPFSLPLERNCIQFPDFSFFFPENSTMITANNNIAKMTGIKTLPQLSKRLLCAIIGVVRQPTELSNKSILL